MTNIGKAIFKTLAYADVFDYPLTFGELYQFLITDKPPSLSSFKKVLSRINADLKLIDAHKQFFFLKGRQKIVVLRKKRERWSWEKLKKAKKIANLLKLISTVKMVGVTGALAMNNSDKDDDIDILIVSARNRLWLTRFLATVLVELTGQRRHPSKFSLLTKNRSCDILSTRDKICLNMFLDEDHLSVPGKERDLYTAHEVSQMRMLWDRESICSKFLEDNNWIREYLPNVNKFKVQSASWRTKFKVTGQSPKLFHFLILICHFALLFFNFSLWEKIFKNFQLWYMRKRRTTEVISDGIIRFHPQDAREWVLTRYKNLLK